jgi:hypothetical protein
MAVSLVRVLAVFRPTNLLALVMLAVVSYGGYYAWRYHQARRTLQDEVTGLASRNAALQQTVADLDEERRKLTVFVERLTTESHVARVHVREARPNADGEPVYTVEFTELDRQGRPLPSRIFDCVGKEVYFDALVIKFSDDAVKTGDILRGKSLHLFRRAFGSAQEPRNGPLIATSQYDDVPNVYRLSPEHADFETRLWRLFWYLAAHPKDAEAEGIRILQIEAQGIRPAVGTTYEITLEHDGGLNIKPLTAEPAPPAPKTTP